MADTQPSNEASSVDLSESTAVCEEDDYAEDPDTAELASGPKTTDAVAEYEGSVKLLGIMVMMIVYENLQCGPTNTSDLDHSRDVPFDVGEFSLTHLVQAEKMSEVDLAESS